MAKIITVTKDNVDEEGFFCFMSKRKSVGYAQKLKWLKERFDEGLVIKKLELPERGFVEYTPGKYAWRSVNAKEYMVIHCFWVVGKSKGKGLAKRLLQECEDDAKEKGLKGVAVVTSEGNWMIAKKLFINQGFTIVEEVEPFTLLVKKFDKSVEDPSFTGDWEEKAKKAGKGMTIFRTNQCPYNEDAVEIYRAVAKKRRIDFSVIELESAKDIREKSPVPYGTFAVVYNGAVLGYSYFKESQILKRLDEMESEQS